MAPKKAAPAKAPAKKETKKAEKPVAAKEAKKKGKGEVDEVELERQKALQAQEEDAEDMDEFAEEGGSGGGSSSSQAGAAAAASAEMSASFKNFRHHPDMENFYRFIFENDLRQEALEILDRMMAEKHAKKGQKSPSSAKSKH